MIAQVTANSRVKVTINTSGAILHHLRGEVTEAMGKGDCGDGLGDEGNG